MRGGFKCLDYNVQDVHRTFSNSCPKKMAPDKLDVRLREPTVYLFCGSNRWLWLSSLLFNLINITSPKNKWPNKQLHNFRNLVTNPLQYALFFFHFVYVCGKWSLIIVYSVWWASLQHGSQTRYAACSIMIDNQMHIGLG